MNQNQNQQDRNCRPEAQYTDKLYLPEMLDNELAADTFGVSKGTLRNWREKRGMPYIRLGISIFYFEDSLERWLRSLETKES